MSRSSCLTENENELFIIEGPLDFFSKHHLERGENEMNIFNLNDWWTLWISNSVFALQAFVDKK